MKRLALGILVLGLLSVPGLAQEPEEGDQEEQTPEMKLKEKVSYELGLRVGQSMKAQLLRIDPEVFARGLRDALYGGQAPMDEAEFQRLAQEFQESIRVVVAEENLKAGEAFLAENGQREGVIITESGLQYEVLVEGSGESPGPADTVVTHYRGTLLDGTQFDSSYDRGQPASFRVDGVIKGWIEALQLMKVGSKWKLYIPANLAYGEQGRPAIPPNSVLIFELELLELKK